MEKMVISFGTLMLVATFVFLTSCTSGPATTAAPVSPAATTGGAHQNPETTMKKQTGGM